MVYDHLGLIQALWNTPSGARWIRRGTAVPVGRARAGRADAERFPAADAESCDSRAEGYRIYRIYRICMDM